MDISLFLAQAFGLYLVIGGVAMLMRPKMVYRLVDTLEAHEGVMTLMGFMVLMLGIPLILVHSIWDGPMWQCLVSLLAWLTFLKGVSLLMFPKVAMEWGGKMWNNQNLLKGAMVLMIILGAYLLKVGFGM